MDLPGPDPPIRSFERQLCAENRSARTVTTYLIAVRLANAFLRAAAAPAWRLAGPAPRSLMWICGQVRGGQWS